MLGFLVSHFVNISTPAQMQKLGNMLVEAGRLKQEKQDKIDAAFAKIVGGVEELKKL